MGSAVARIRIGQVTRIVAICRRLAPAALIFVACGVCSAARGRGFRPPLTLRHAQTPAQANAPKLTWHTLEFAIVRYNGGTPNSWNIYHSQKKGVLLVRLWKRYLLVRVNDEEVYDIDPEKIKVTGDAVEWSTADIPDKPIETPDWKERNLGPVELIRFRLGKDGHVLELQIPFGPDGKPMY
jgi:hypothetical protein